MKMEVVAAGKKIRLDPKEVLGSGGEAIVTKNGKHAYKIFHKPSARKLKKIEALLKKKSQLPERIVTIEEIVRDKNGKVIGYRMPLVEANSEALKVLSNRNFRITNNVNTRHITEIFNDAAETLSELHRKGFVVGDLNDLNELFLGNKVFYIDADSFQFDQFPCEAATEDFVHPSLYPALQQKNPTKSGFFTPETDWYSFAVLFFRSLLLVHPYGGTFSGVKLLTERTVKKITVLDSGVRYPQVGRNPEILSDDLAEIFFKFFKYGGQTVFPTNAIEEYGDILIECSNCHEYFPRERGNCPVCSKKSTFVLEHKVQGDYKILLLAETEGEFVFSKQVGQKIYLIAYEKGKTVLYKWQLGTGLKKTELFEVVPGLIFDIGLGMLLVMKKGSKQILVIDPDDGSVIFKTQTDLFQGYPIAAGTNSALYRMTGGLLLKSEMVLKNLTDRVLRPVSQDQTWFSLTEEGKGKIIIVSRIFGNMVYQVVTDGMAYDAEVNELGEKAKLVSLSAKFDSRGILIMREVKEGGKNYLLYDYLNDKGKLLSHIKEKWDENVHGNIHGSVLGNGYLILATNDGLKGKSVTKKENSDFVGTEKFIQGGEKLYSFGGDIVAVRENEIILIKKGGGK